MTDTLVSWAGSDVGLATILAVIAATLLVGFFLWRKGRPLPAGSEGRVFRASRLSRGNFLFPTQVLITPTSLVHYTPQWIGKLEHSIHIAHIASVKIDTNLFFSNVLVETSGGTSTVSCHGHRKSDAVAMKKLVEKYQTEYYRAGRG